MIYFILLITGNALAVTDEFSLDCTNDLDTSISCYIDAHNCSRLSLKMDRLKNVDESMTGTCGFEPCNKGCCCNATFEFLIPGDDFSANMYKDGQPLHNQKISIYDTFKPPAPSFSIEQFSGIHTIQWCSNAPEYIRDELEAVVTYQKKGSNSKPFEHKGASTKMNESCYEMNGHSLEPDTTYVVSVKTYKTSGVLSDSSKKEFTTPLKQTSTNGHFIAIILCLSVVVTIVSATAFVLYFRLKGKFWDKAAKEETPPILNFKPNKNVILTPESLSVTSLSVEPLIPKVSLTLSKESLFYSSSGQTSGISTASSSPAYNDMQPDDIGACVLQALNNAFPNFPPAQDASPSDEPPQGNTGSPPLEKTSPPIFFNNMCYVSNNQNYRTDDVDKQMNYDTGYDSSEGPPLQDFIAPPHASVAMETDMSYQPCPIRTSQ